jgi:hypothetical protein
VTTAANLFTTACIPLALLDTALLIAVAMLPKGRARRAIGTTGVLLFGVCLLGVLVFFHTTKAMVANGWFVFALFGLLLLLEVLWPPARAKILKQKGRVFGWVVLIGISIIGFAFFTLCGWYFVGDFLLESQHVQGMLTQKHLKSGKYGIPRYYLHFNDRDYETTAEVYENISGRGYSWAEIGTASNMIFKIESVPFPQTAPPVQQYSLPPVQQK